MSFTDIIGIIAGSLTTMSFFPQVHKVYKTKKTDDLSLLMFLFTFIGMSIWIIYGVILMQLPIILANSISVCMAFYILIMKVRNNIKNRSKS